MKRLLLYIAALTLLLLADRGTDLGSLRPVELVQLWERNGILILETDTGDRGWGLTIDQAVAKLKETTPGQIYLDTADYLLLEEGTEQYLPQLHDYMKKGTRMAYSVEGLNLRDAAAYLRIHKPSRDIRRWRKPAEKLVLEAGRINLKKFQET